MRNPRFVVGQKMEPCGGFIFYFLCYGGYQIGFLALRKLFSPGDRVTYHEMLGEQDFQAKYSLWGEPLVRITIMKSVSEWQTQTYHVPINNTTSLAGFLNIPPSARGVVLFAHGSGSGRHSPRNQFVARALHQVGFATMLIDLFTGREEEYDRYTGQLRFDIALLSERVAAATTWLLQYPLTTHLRVGYFGASTGAAAALVAAANQPAQVAAVVSRGGRPDLAGPSLAQVQAPTLLIVGSADTQVVPLNEAALAWLSCEKQLTLVPGATHLFEESGTLEQVAQLASQWFARYLS